MPKSTRRISRIDQRTRAAAASRKPVVFKTGFQNALTSDGGDPNPKFGQRTREGATRPPTGMFTSEDERDYFREDAAARARMPDQPAASITPQRITQSVRMRANTIRGLSFERLTSYLDQWRLGFFRQAGMLWDTMLRRDYQLQIAAPKRLKSVARHGYDIMTVEEIPDGLEAMADEQARFLKYFYDHLSTTTALNPDEEGGLSLLLRQMMGAVGTYYSVHEIVWQPQADGNLTARFIHCPVWWFEGTRGKLRFLDSEFQVYGREMDPGEWLVTCGDGLMEACSVLYLFKALPMKSWITYLDKFAQPGLHLKTDAQKGSTEWNDAVEALTQFAEDFATVTNRSAELSLIEAKASGDASYDRLIEKIDRAITQLWRGGDLGTTSGQNAHGASLQGDESEILETDDAKMLEETLTAKVSRYALQWKFGPDVPQLAYVKLRTTPRQNIKDDLSVDQWLAAQKFPMTLGSLAERYSRDLPEGVDPGTLSAAPSAPDGAEPDGDETPSAELANAKPASGRLSEKLSRVLAPLRARLAAIAAMRDATMQRQALAELINDAPALKQFLRYSPRFRQALEAEVEARFIQGTKP